MDILPLSKKYKKALADLLIGYWKERGMTYSSQWTHRYLTEGHRIEILGEAFFVAVEKGDVVGSMSLVFWEPDVAEMRDFFVLPKFRKYGVGNKLLDAVLKECERRKIRKVFAYVLPEAEGFFLKRGFRKEGTLKEHYQKGEDLIAIGKLLR